MELYNLEQLFSQLIKDEESDIQTRRVTQGSMSLIVAELKAGRKLPAHYHTKDAEIYQVISGQGRMALGRLLDGERVEWDKIFELKAGDILEVAPFIVHSLQGGNEDLRLIFITPPSHLGDDRIFVK